MLTACEGCDVGCDGDLCDQGSMASLSSRLLDRLGLAPENHLPPLIEHTLAFHPWAGPAFQPRSAYGHGETLSLGFSLAGPQKYSQSLILKAQPRGPPQLRGQSAFFKR